MIVGEEFSAWLSSRERQAASRSRAAAAGKRWSQRPIWADLRTEIEAAEGDVDSLTAAACRALERDSDIAEIVDETMAQSRTDPFFRPPFQMLASELHSGLLLFDSPEVMISLGVIGLEPLAAKKAGPRGATSIMFNGERTLLRLVKAGEATFSFWEAPAATESFAADEPRRCRLTDRRRVYDEETFLLDGSTRSFVIEHARSNLIVMQAVIHRGAAPFSVEYDSRSCDFIGASSTDESGSRIEMMTTLLRLLDVRDAIPLIRQVLAGSSFHTRWHLTRELLAWDAEAALPVLQEMAERDPHLDVREAAGRTLSMFFRDEKVAPCPV